MVPGFSGKGGFLLSDHWRFRRIIPSDLDAHSGDNKGLCVIELLENENENFPCPSITLSAQLQQTG